MLAIAPIPWGRRTPPRADRTRARRALRAARAATVLVLAFCGAMTSAQSAVSLSGVTGLAWSPNDRHIVATRITVAYKGRPFDLLLGTPSPASKGAANARDGVWVFSRSGEVDHKVASRVANAGWTKRDRLLLGPERTTTAQPYWRVVDSGGQQVDTVLAVLSNVTAWRASPDGEYLAYVGYSRDPAAAALLAVAVQPTDRASPAKVFPVRALSPIIAWSPDSRFVYGGGDDGDWRLDVVRGRLDEKQRSLFASTADRAATSDGRLIVADTSGGISVVDWSSGTVTRVAEVGTFSDPVTCAAEGVFACVRHTDPRHAEVWIGRVAGGHWALTRLGNVTVNGRDIALSHDGTRLACGGGGDRLQVHMIAAAH
jgi:hypothetical protein